MIPEFLVLVLVPAVLLAAAGWDLASFTIPNFLQAVLLAGFAVFALATATPLAALGWHVLAAGVGLAIGFTLFALGIVGGGDAKLFACVALWFGFPDLLPFALIASLFGGVLTVVILGFRYLPLPGPLARQAWLMRLHDQKSGIPYGVALASGAFAVLPYTDVFRIGVAG
ncbi:MAG TPA: prepilin peptidase [Rhizomicrobium sp.]|jgi:prepilin peptidase CpaA|nr:prepilin peptidase [Rhizomicrobium sp.]